MSYWEEKHEQAWNKKTDIEKAREAFDKRFKPQTYWDKVKEDDKEYVKEFILDDES